MPVGDVLVRDTGGDIEHDDTTLAVDVVSISQTAELLLTSCVPYIELNRSQVLSRKVSRPGEAKWNDRAGLLAGHTVVNVRGCTSTPRVAMYFFSNSPVRWRLTKVVYNVRMLATSQELRHGVNFFFLVGGRG